jgi:hypothetical protein
VQVDEINDIAYVGAGQRLVALDISNPAAPVEIGAINLLSSVKDLVVRDGYAFVATNFDPYRFCVVDILDPSAMALVWHVPQRPLTACRPGDQPNRVYLYRNIVYVHESLRTVAYDISDPHSVITVANFAGLCVGGNWNIRRAPKDYAIVGDRMYMATAAESGGVSSSLRIFDLLIDPLNPPQLGEVNLSAEPESVAVEGDYAYVTVDGTTGDLLYVVDVQDPTAPQIVGSLKLDLKGRIAVRDRLVYGGTFNALVTIDATTPSNPVIAHTIEMRSEIPYGAALSGDRVYVMAPAEGMLMLDLQSPAAPSPLGRYHSPGALRQLDKTGDLLFVSDFWYGFSILDVSDPARPVFLGAHEAASVPSGSYTRGIHGVSVFQDTAYLVNGTGELEIVDVSDPTDPTLLRVLDEGLFRPQGVAVSLDSTGRTIAHVGVLRSLVELNVSDPENIEELGRAQISTSSTTPMTVVLNQGRDTAFIGRQSVWGAVDVQNPGMPVTLHSGEPNPSQDVAVAGDTLYVVSQPSGEDGGLYIFDVSNPAAPVTLGQYGALGFKQPGAVAVQNGRAYLIALTDVVGTGSSYLLNVHDVTEPSAPVTLASAQGVGTAHGNAYFDDILADEPSVFTVGSQTGDGNVAGLVIFDSRCAPDCDQSTGVGILDVFDFLCFQDAFVSMRPYADCDENGAFDVFDFLCFQDQFTLGCP